jgi:hypothetical protein
MSLGVFPNDLNLSTKPRAVPARSYRSSVSPVNGNVFQPSSIVKLDLPTGGSTFLDGKQSYLKFKVTNNSATGTDIALAGSAYGFINRLEIYHAGQLLESLSEYSTLATAFMDLQSASGLKAGSGSLLMGTRQAADNNKGCTITPGTTRSFCLPMMSGVIGAWCSKYLPLAFMDAADIRIELTLSSREDGVVGAAACLWSISDVEYVGTVVELDSDSMRMLRQSTNNGSVEISSESVRAYNYSVAQGVTAVSQLIPAKFSSLKSVLGTYRLQASLGTNDSNSIDRVKPTSSALYTTQLRVGGLHVPQKPIAGDSEHYAETLKSMHALADIGVAGLITEANYVITGATVASAARGKFVWGVDLESFAHKTDVIETGYNTQSTNLYVDQSFGTATPEQLRMDVFAHFDMFLSISNGLAVVKF